MREIAAKTDGTGDLLSANAFNSNFITELQLLVTSAGYTLDPEAGPDTDLTMLSKSILAHVLGGQYFDENGAADAYVLTRSGTLPAVTSYFDGLIVVFNPANDNTGASTVNVDSVGVKSIVTADGSALTGGEINADDFVILRYNSGSDYFEIVFSKGVITDGTADQLILDPTPNADQTGNGIKATKTVDSNATGIGALLYLASDGNYDEADASASTTMPCSALALESSTGSKQILKEGYFRDDSWSWTPGAILYVSTTTGAITATAPNGSGDQIQPIGTAESATVIYFNPDLTVLEHI